MTVGHVSIFLPLETEFYAGLLAQMRRGFEQCGVATSGGLGHLGADDLRTWCQNHRPDVVLEMNRPGADAQGLPPGTRHVVWVVDFDGRTLDHFAGSDITYLFGPSWVERYPHSGFHRWLGPGACPDSYPLRPLDHRRDASFAGFIPRPWAEGQRARDVTGGVGALHFEDLLPAFERALEQARDELKTADDFVRIAAQTCLELCGHPLVLDARLRNDVTGRVIREINRRALIDAAADAVADLELFGPDTWALWPQYRDLYRGMLQTAAQMHAVYTSSAVNLHEGNGIHFRSMDVMCSGGLLFFRTTANDQRVGGIENAFTPREHYVPFTLSTLRDELEYYGGLSTDAQRIRGEAAREIRARHTWRHRAASILSDLASV